MDTEKLIEIAKECGAYVREDSTGVCTITADLVGLQQFAQRIEKPLRDQLTRQAKAALSGMAAAKRVASQMLKDAEASKPELVESERQANAVLTEENEKQQQRIAELENALRYIKEWTDRYTSPGHPISTVAGRVLSGESK